MRHRIVADIVAAYEQADVERAPAMPSSAPSRIRHPARQSLRVHAAPMAIDVFAPTSRTETRSTSERFGDLTRRVLEAVGR